MTAPAPRARRQDEAVTVNEPALRQLMADADALPPEVRRLVHRYGWKPALRAYHACRGSMMQPETFLRQQSKTPLPEDGVQTFDRMERKARLMARRLGLKHCAG